MRTVAEKESIISTRGESGKSGSLTKLYQVLFDTGKTCSMVCMNGENIKEAKRAGHDAVMDEMGNIVTFNSKQTKPIYTKSGLKEGDLKVTQMNDLNKLETKKRQMQTDSVKPVDERTIAELQNKVSTVESTAYSDADVAAVDKTLDEFAGIDEQIALERELQFMQDDIATMREQGILTDEEVKLLSSLDNVDAELAINENVLLNAQLCLLRG